MYARQLSTAVVALALTTTPAKADVAGRYENTQTDAFIDMEMTVETDDDGNVRMQMAGQPGYYLLKDGELFIVSRGPTIPSVARVTDTLAIQAELLARMGVSDRFTDEPVDLPKMEFVALGPETVGAWQGTAYGFKTRSSENAPQAVLVLSDDQRIAPLGRAMVAMQSDMITGMGRFTGVLSQLGRDYEALLSNGTPVRMAQMELTDVSFDTIDPERFALPAPPSSIEELRVQSSAFPPPPTLPPREN